MESKGPFEVLIIGSGIGGLSVGIILARLGYRVSIIERNALPGGLMRGYRRQGVTCPVGVHYVGGFDEGEPLRRMCDYLGVTQGMAMERMGESGPTDRYLFDHFTYDLPVGLDAFRASLEAHFPDEGQAIAKISENLRILAGMQNDFAFLAPSPPPLNPSLFAPLSEYLTGLKCSMGLRSVLGVAARWMGLPENECPVFYHHLALTSYLASSWRLRDGGADMAEAFLARFSALGGTLLCGDPVAKILVAGEGIKGVKLASGRVLMATRVVAAIHPKPLFAMLPEGVLKARHARRLSEFSETESLFAVNALVDAGTPALPHNIFRLYSDGAGTIIDGNFYQVRHAGAGKNLLVAMTRSPYADWQKWEGTTTGRRGPAYDAEKGGRAERLLLAAEESLGTMAGAKIIDAYTPLTLRDWANAPEGSPYGVARSLQQLPLLSALHRLAPAGLYLGGQNAVSPGVLGTLLGSFQAVRQMIGPERFAAEVFNSLAPAPERQP